MNNALDDLDEWLYSQTSAGREEYEEWEEEKRIWREALYEEFENEE